MDVHQIRVANLRLATMNDARRNYRRQRAMRCSYCSDESPLFRPCSCSGWSWRSCWTWLFNLVRELRDLYRDYMGTLPKRSFIKSSGDYYDWLIEVLRLAAKPVQDERDVRRCYRSLNHDMKRSRRLLLIAFLDHYEEHRESCGQDARAVVTLMVEHCKKMHPNLQDVVASELLRRAIARRHVEVVRLLLDLVEHIDAYFIQEIRYDVQRPLSAAVNSGSVDIVRMILERGAQIDVVPVGWERPVLLVAAQKKYKEITVLLLHFGANPHVKDQVGRGALHWLVRANTPGIAKIFVDLGVSVADKDENGLSALMEAVQYNDHYTVRFFLDYCVLTEDELNDAICMAITPKMSRRLPIVRMLLLRGAHPDGGSPPHAYETPLDRAVIDDMYSMARELIIAGADVNRVLLTQRRFSARMRRLLLIVVVERLEAGEAVCSCYEEALQIDSDSLYEDCLEERRRMSKTRIVPGVKFDVVKQIDEGSFAAAMREYGCDLVRAFMGSVKLLFPIHADELTYRFDLMKDKWEKKWQVELVVSQLWDGMLPLTAVRMIADYLHPNDLEVVEPNMAKVDDLRDLTYPRQRISAFQRRRGVIHWRRRRSYS